MKNAVWNDKYKRYFARNSDGYRLWQEAKAAGDIKVSKELNDKLSRLVKQVDAEYDALLLK